MSEVELKANDAKPPPEIQRRSVLSSLRVVPALATAVAVTLATALGYQAWQYYMGSPWTRDGTVRAYVVKIAPQVAGEIVQLPIADDQFVHKGDLLMLIDPRNYSIAVRQAQAAVDQARATADNANAEMTRRLKLSDLAVTAEERQTYVSQAATAEASYQSALANLDQVRVNFQRTRVRSPVNGYVTNLSAQLGDYAAIGALQLSIINSDSFWVDAYFEEIALGRIHEGDAATIKLMGFSPLLRGRVQGLARGINAPNATPDAFGLASVNPIFTFVRLAQRVPVRIHIDEVPEDVKLVAGLTATVQIEPYKAPPVSNSTPAPAAASQVLPQAAQPQGAGHAATQATPLQTPGQAPGQSPPPLATSAPLSPRESAAAAAASSDLKTLEGQIAAFPPTGGAPAPTAANRPSDSSADTMPPSTYLGKTIDLFGDQGAAPETKRPSPDSIHRRARSIRRHYREP